MWSALSSLAIVPGSRRTRKQSSRTTQPSSAIQAGRAYEMGLMVAVVPKFRDGEGGFERLLVGVDVHHPAENGRPEAAAGGIAGFLRRNRAAQAELGPIRVTLLKGMSPPQRRMPVLDGFGWRRPMRAPLAHHDGQVRGVHHTGRRCVDGDGIVARRRRLCVPAPASAPQQRA